MYRPRGSLARVLYEKCVADEKLKEFNKNQGILKGPAQTFVRETIEHRVLQTIGKLDTVHQQEWYKCDLRYLPQNISEKFVQMSMDEDTKHFLEESIDKSGNILLQIWHSIVKTILGLFMTQTSINGLLRRGSMFVFSYQQFLQLTSPQPLLNRSRTPTRLLDLGAGDGEVTSKISHLYEEVYVTEISRPMRWILSSKGFRILEINSWSTGKDLDFDMITCLNLLDRCDRPHDVLMDMKQVLKPDGVVIVAIVFPFEPYVETGTPDHKPIQQLDIQGDTFEEQVESTIGNVLEPCGFQVIRWTRLPYLCEGDLNQAYYWLNDAVFFMKAKKQEEKCTI